MKEGALSLQTSLSHRELSHRTPLLQERKFVSLFVTAGFCGKVFLSDWEVRDFLQGAAIALFLWVGNIYETHSTNQSGAKPHRQKNTSRQKQKLPPRAPVKAKRNKLSQCKVGALGGSSGRMREVWREKGHPPNGGPFSLQGLLHPIRPSSKRSRKTLTERTERNAKRTAKASGKRVAISGVSAGLRR